jgi:carboxymethylproline synthase
MIHLRREGAGAVIEIRHDKPVNPFTRAMTRQLIERCEEVEGDDDIAGVMIWGGADRSFSVGGDFEDLARLVTREQTEQYLVEIIRSYQAVLNISKPVVTAIDHHAIGQGLQVALLGDWRIGTDRSRYSMPELANGMPCPLGSAMLEAFFGRARMLHLVVGCKTLDADDAARQLLINELRPHAELESAALEKLSTLCGYPANSYRSTKSIHNGRLIRILDDVCEDAARAHGESFSGGNTERLYERFIGHER